MQAEKEESKCQCIDFVNEEVSQLCFVIGTVVQSGYVADLSLLSDSTQDQLFSLFTMTETKGKFDFAIDRGGTFTDVFARLPDGRERVLKLLSRDPQNYKDAPTEGIRRVLEEVTHDGQDGCVNTCFSEISSIFHS